MTTPNPMTAMLRLKLSEKPKEAPPPLVEPTPSPAEQYAANRAQFNFHASKIIAHHKGVAPLSDEEYQLHLREEIRFMWKLQSRPAKERRGGEGSTPRQPKAKAAKRVYDIDEL